MRRNDHTQTSLAEIMGISQSALSQRLKKDNPQIFMDIASAFPAAGDVTATLLTDLAEIYHNLFLENLNIALANGDDAARAARDWLEKNGREKE